MAKAGKKTPKVEELGEYHFKLSLEIAAHCHLVIRVDSGQNRLCIQPSCLNQSFGGLGNLGGRAALKTLLVKRVDDISKYLVGSRENRRVLPVSFVNIRPFF
jgi:hypothetical protein